MTAMTACLDDETVLGMVEGRLAEGALAVTEEHLDGCATCRDVVAQLARTRSQLARGHTVGRFVIGDLLGSGAMGRVYSAWQPELDRRVAIKLLREDIPAELRALADPAAYRRMTAAASELVDGEGTHRVAEAMSHA